MLSAPKLRDSLRLQERFLPLPANICAILRGPKMRCLATKNRQRTATFSAIETFKTDSHYGIGCGTQARGETTASERRRDIWKNRKVGYRTGGVHQKHDRGRASGATLRPGHVLRFSIFDCRSMAF